MIRTPAVQPLLARLHLARQGDPARQQRAIRAAMPDPDYRTAIESEVRRGFAGTRVTASDVSEDAAADTMKVEDLPKPFVLDSTFGPFRLEWTTQAGRVERTLQLRMPRTIVPPEQHDELRTFLDAVRTADRASVVLTP